MSHIFCQARVLLPSQSIPGRSWHVKKSVLHASSLATNTAHVKADPEMAHVLLSAIGKIIREQESTH